MEMNLERVRTNVEQATTEDLLDRATIYRHEMEPDALDLIDRELARRNVTQHVVEEHLADRGDVLSRADGTIVVCSFCHRPAIESAIGWHRLFGKVPLFPRLISRCELHLEE